MSQVNNIHHLDNQNIHINRKKKISLWMKKIIQPNSYTNEQQQQPKQKKQSPKVNNIQLHDLPYEDDVQTINSSIKPIFPHDERKSKSKSLKLQWDQEPEKLKATQNTHHHDIMDDSSVAPLFSYCSSSIKSSTFSDIHSVQSTRPTLLSTRTIDTNSSTVPIPPASILDRARNNTNYSSAASISSHHGQQNMPNRPPSARHLQRHNSSHTVNSIITIMS